MLVISRKIGETIRIGEEVVVTVVRTAVGSVRIGVEAPKDVRISRGELVDLTKDSKGSSDGN